MEKLFERTDLFKIPVGLFQDSFVLIIQPVALTFINGIHGLSIQLLVVDGDIRINRCSHFDTDKAAAAAGIGKQVHLITGTNKRGITAHFLNGRTVRFPQICHRFLQKMFQKALLVGANLIKLIQVHQQKTPQITLRILFALKIKTIRISKTQFRRQNNATIGRFTIPLCPNQQWRRTVSMLAVEPTPVSHHTEKPAIKQLPPMRIIAWHKIGKCPDAVFSVPTPHTAKVFFDRIVQRHIL